MAAKANRKSQPTEHRAGRHKNRAKARGKLGGARVGISASAAGVIYDGDSMDSWTNDELQRGRKRSKDGTFRGADPVVVPKALHDELVRRTMHKAHLLLRTNTWKAVGVLIEVATDKEADARARVRAAELILDRTMGRVPQFVDVEVSEMQPWQKLIASSIVGSVEDMKAKGEVVDVEVVEEDG